jgi:RNA polymerase primary sigma factor
MKKLRNASRGFLQRHGREATVEELAELCNLTVEEAGCVARMSRQPVSLDQPLGEADEGGYSDLVKDHREDDPLRDVNQQSLRSSIARVLEELPYREREIIRLRFGLTDGYAYTLEEVGTIFSVTRERVRQIEAKAVEKLRQPGVHRDLAGFVDDGLLDALRRRQMPQAPDVELEPAFAGAET